VVAQSAGNTVVGGNAPVEADTRLESMPDKLAASVLLQDSGRPGGRIVGGSQRTGGCAGGKAGIAVEKSVGPEFSFAHIQVEGAILNDRPGRQREIAVDALRQVMLQDNIDDTARGIGVVFGSRVGNDLDALDLAGRDGLQDIGDIASEYGRRLAVDQKEDIGASLQLDIAVHIHRYLWHFLQQVGGDSGLRGKVPFRIEYQPVDLVVDQFWRRGYNDRLQRGGPLNGTDPPQVENVAVLGYFDISDIDGPVPDEFDD